MNLHRLQVFHAVARQLSFSRAAEELYTSQPNVSKHIRQLEQELGVRLFHRLGTRIALTDAGRIVFDYAQRIFELTEGVQRALAELEGLERGYLRLGASSTPGVYLLPQALATFCQRYPNLEVILEVTNSQHVVEGVRAGELDLGFVGEYVEAAGLQVQPYVLDEVVLIAPADHPLTDGRDVSPDDLRGETFIMREAGSGTSQIVEEAMARLGIQPHRTLELSGCEAVKRSVAAGLGVSFVSRYAIGLELAQGVLSVLEGPGLCLSRQLYIISRKDIRPTAAVLTFTAHLHKTPLPTERP
ncbi:MAG: selenium metabolism-associated LysR family transcriptional regulator [Anaerolineae bacterium]